MALPVYTPSIITAVGKAQQGLAAPKFIMGGKGGPSATAYQIFKKDSSYNFAVLRTEKYKIGQPFKVIVIRLPLSIALAANMTIIPVLYIDDEAITSVGTTINSTNYANSEKLILLTPDNFGGKVGGDKNFYLELQFTGSALIGATFPINIDVELLEKV